MGASVKGLKLSEQAWVEQATLHAVKIVKAYQIGGDHPRITPAILDQAYAAWLENPLPEFEPTGVFNAIGVAFGQYLVDHAGMRWVVYSKDGEKDIAAYRAQGKVVVFPARVVRKRYPTRETHFLTPMYNEMVKSISTALQPPPPPKAPWWKFGFQN